MDFFFIVLLRFFKSLGSLGIRGLIGMILFLKFLLENKNFLYILYINIDNLVLWKKFVGIIN